LRCIIGETMRENVERAARHPCAPCKRGVKRAVARKPRAA
jgi:hypothetical protein